jgi:hypothetical protein
LVIISRIDFERRIFLMKKIVLTGGGTAGHVTPNIALIPELKKAGYEIYYIGSYDGIEKNWEFLIMVYQAENCADT